MPYQRAEIAEYFAANSSRFPQVGRMSEVSPLSMLAELSYSSLFCKRLVASERNKAPAERWVYGAVDFGQPLAQLGSPAMAGALVTDMARQFWGRTPSSEESAIFVEETREWATAKDAGGADRLDFALNSVCSTLLSTPQVWLELQ